MSSQEVALAFSALLPHRSVGSHSALRSALRVASFLARFFRPRAFFPLGIAKRLCRVADQRRRVDIEARNATLRRELGCLLHY